MSPQTTGVLGFCALVVLLVFGCPVGLALIVIGALGVAAIIGPMPALRVIETAVFDVATNASFTLIPLFLLMGALAARAGLSRDLFAAAHRLTRGWPGGLALTGITASAAFAAISGSSLATASTMTRIAWPEMARLGTDPRLAAGSLAAGATLGIMIPPSIALLLYALITEQSVAAMFLAGVLPGLLGFVLYAVAAMAVARVWQAGGQPEALAGTLSGVLPVLGLFTLVIAGLYGGVFTPLEAGGVGAALALVLALWRGVGLGAIRAAFTETVVTAATLFFILIGAEVFGYLLSLSRLTQLLSATIDTAGWGAFELMAAILVLYLVLGCILESLAMILLTVPVLYPLVVAAGIDPIWFGIICVVAVEVGLITPPLGLNLFVVRAGVPGLSLGVLWRGVVPFVAADLVRLALLLALPCLALWLPRSLGY
ncbi:MAG: TRAP transporter large permease [Pseudomonadota bacterium]